MDLDWDKMLIDISVSSYPSANYDHDFHMLAEIPVDETIFNTNLISPEKSKYPILTPNQRLIKNKPLSINKYNRLYAQMTYITTGHSTETSLNHLMTATFKDDDQRIIYTDFY